VALDLSESMNAIDVAPTRLERGKQKIRDLLALREGARTALVAYAGSAHTVLPLSNDRAILETFLSSLETNVMPVEGKDPSKALDLAEGLLNREDVPGSILFLTDGVASKHVPAFVEHAARSSDAVMVLAIGTRDGGPVRSGKNDFATDASGRRVVAKLDAEGLEELSRRTGIFVASVTVDGEDVRRVQRLVQRHLEDAQNEDETARWRDFGYYFTFPIACLALAWFRRGWTVRWSAVLLLLLPGCSADVWLTPDQQGRRLFEREAFGEAAATFEDPMWRGVAYYRAGDFERAIDAFARVETPEAHFDLGNAYARMESYEQAVASYESALERRPDWLEARENLELVRARIAQTPDEEDTPPAGDPTFSADEVQFDEKGKKGQEGEVEMSLLTDEQLSEMWMRRLSASPADFLRRRFQMEVSEK